MDEAQVDQSVEKITSVLQKFGGSILKLDKWGKKRLAYRVKKNKFGYYLNIYHTCEADKVPDLEKEYQLYDLVIKYLVIRLEDRDIERVMSQAAEAAKAAESAEAAKVAEAETPKPAEAEASKPAEAEVKDESKKDVTTEKSD